MKIAEFDITEAVYGRMIPKSSRKNSQTTRSGRGKPRADAGGQLYSSVREEAILCFRRTSRRGFVLFQNDRWRFVCEPEGVTGIASTSDDFRRTILQALTDSDPEREVIIVHACGGWCSAIRMSRSNPTKWLGQEQLSPKPAQQCR